MWDEEDVPGWDELDDVEAQIGESAVVSRRLRVVRRGGGDGGDDDE